jgi:hypothetical protein
MTADWEKLVEAAHVDDVFVFDFDGVLADPAEDDIYRIPFNSDASSQGAETEFLMTAARAFGLRCSRMDIRYQRHLVFQCAADLLSLDIGPGPSLAAAKKASEKCPVFVITARSSWHAVSRARSFLKVNQISPLEVFHTGQVSKDRYLSLLLSETRASRVFCFEDDSEHINAARLLGDPRLSVIPVRRLHPPESHSRLRQIMTEVIVAALKRESEKCGKIGAGDLRDLMSAQSITQGIRDNDSSYSRPGLLQAQTIAHGAKSLMDGDHTDFGRGYRRGVNEIEQRLAAEIRDGKGE